LSISGCNVEKETEPVDLFEYKDSYVGDSGAVSKIMRELPSPDGEKVGGLELKTTEEPYGIILNYREAEESEGIETNYNELALYNATYFLCLVKNADWVKFNFENQMFTITRDELEAFYGKDIRKFTTEEELSLFIQENLEDEDKVSKFFN
jgi:hypothetical protein